MSNCTFTGDTLDDLMRGVIEEVFKSGTFICPSRGPAKELSGILLELKNPLARISRTESRGKLFSCLGELLWYLSKNKDADYIKYYISQYSESADNGEIFGAYGPCLFDWDNVNQFAKARELLHTNPASRRAVIQLFDHNDLVEQHSDVPCTCNLQFMVRHGKLHFIVFMRSNDVYLGLPHDIFCFTMLQEIMARDLGLELGTYKHMVGSLHIYVDDKQKVQGFLSEGWQPTKTLMPPMPLSNPWPSIKCVLTAERAIRTGLGEEALDLSLLDPYWADIVRLLQVFGASKKKDLHKIKLLRDEFSSSTYHPYIDQRAGLRL